MLTCVDLFSGIGGMALGAQRAGFAIKLLCEIEPFCQAVLREHFPDVPIVEDVHDVSFPGVQEGEGPTLLTGGFPFQAANARGERRENDPNSLWDQFARVASEIRPTWVVAETIPRFVRLGIDEAAWDLERAGYAVTAIVLPSHAVDCPTRRDRLYLIGARGSDTRLPDVGVGGQDFTIRRWPDPEPEVCRVADRLPGRMDQQLDSLVALGDATVPPGAEVLLRDIAEFERSLNGSGH